MRHLRFHLAVCMLHLASPSLMFWKRGNVDDRRQSAFDDLYDVLAAVYETAAGLKPEWSEQWENRFTNELPPRYQQESMLPERTLNAVREVRFARTLLQRHRWRSVRQPLFEDVPRVAWASLQRRLQIVCAELLAVEDENRDVIRQDETDWIARAVEGYDNARAYLRSAEREGQPVERQVADSAYVAIHLAVQLSDRLIERQRFELTEGE